ESPDHSAIVQGDDLMAAQLVDRRRRAMRGQILRARAGPELRAGDSAGDQVGVGKRTGTDRDVDVVGQRPDRLVVEAEYETQLGVTREKAGEQRGQRASGERGWCAHAERAARDAHEARDRVLRLADFFKDASRMTLEQEPRIGEPESPRRSLDE